MRILLVENDQKTLAFLKRGLKNQYSIDTFQTLEEGEYQATVTEYDLVLIGYSSIKPGALDAPTFCHNLRSYDIQIPIVVLSHFRDISAKVKILNAGADDYLTIPFTITELTAHLRALLRRSSQQTTSTTLQLADLCLDLQTHTVTRHNQRISMRRKEKQILEYFLRNKGQILSREMIMEHIWDSTHDPDKNTIDVHIKHLRDKVDRGYPKQLIKTVYGFGYKVEE